MASRKWLLVAVGAALLAGCADYPYYNDNSSYYNDGYAYRSYPSYSYNQPYYPNGGYWYGPGYYVAPSIGLGFSYSNRPYYYRGRWYG